MSIPEFLENPSDDQIKHFTMDSELMASLLSLLLNFLSIIFKDKADVAG